MCDQENFFIENGRCKECSLEGCLECESLSACQVCDEENNYVLNNKKQCKKEGLLPYQIGLIAFGCAVVLIAIIIYAGNYNFNDSVCEVYSTTAKQPRTSSFSRNDNEGALNMMMMNYYLKYYFLFLIYFAERRKINE